jgi:group II intron reverse transcriptase/maturase
MARTTLTQSSEEQAAGLSRPGGASARGAVGPGNQGTNSVRGTWSSEGEAGRHPRSAAEAAGTSSPEPILFRLDRIAAQAREYPEMTFTTLAHLLDVPMLERAFWSLNPKSAPGVDRVTWRQYQQDLTKHLEDLHEKLVKRTYTPQPVARRWIPKSNGKLRPLGLPALEDKVVSKAVAELLEPIYEQDFCSFSYGFRPGRSCHQALHDLRQGLLRNRVQYVLDCDISSFFDNLRHDVLLSLVRKRIKDGRLLELIEQWLKAGIMDGKERVFPEKGSPQGSVISPLLANVYLHEVLDKWFAEEVVPRCRGRVMLIRYADDFVIGCERAEDAERIMQVLPLRFAKYGLEINREKTKLVRFVRPRWNSSVDGSGQKPGTFSFLGFVHYWGKTWKGGHTIKRKTAGKRLSRTLSSLWEWCRENRHRPLPEQYQTLCAKLRGHYQYYGVRCNSRCLDLVHYVATRAWRYWLNRRGDRKLTWQKFGRLLAQFPLPKPKIVQAWV